jgi:excisionase family DNA binding protein
MGAGMTRDLSGGAASRDPAAHRGQTPPREEMKFFTIAEVAAFVGVSVRTVRRWIERKKLVAYYFGAAVRIAEILLFLPALYAAWFRIKSPGEEVHEAKPAWFSIWFERPKTIGRSMSELNPSRFRRCARFPRSAEVAVSKND